MTKLNEKSVIFSTTFKQVDTSKFGLNLQKLQITYVFFLHTIYIFQSLIDSPLLSCKLSESSKLFSKLTQLYYPYPPPCHSCPHPVSSSSSLVQEEQWAAALSKVQQNKCPWLLILKHLTRDLSWLMIFLCRTLLLFPILDFRLV